MVSRGNPFCREYSTSDSSETGFPKDPSPERKVNPELEVLEHLYPVSLEVVNDLRRITRSYAKKLGGLMNIRDLPRRKSHIREIPYIEYSVLVGDFEELVDLTLQ